MGKFSFYPLWPRTRTFLILSNWQKTVFAHYESWHQSRYSLTTPELPHVNGCAPDCLALLNSVNCSFVAFIFVDGASRIQGDSLCPLSLVPRRQAGASQGSGKRFRSPVLSFVTGRKQPPFHLQLGESPVLLLVTGKTFRPSIGKLFDFLWVNFPTFYG